MNPTAFWALTPCISVPVHRSFEYTFCHHSQGRKVNQERNQQEEGGKLFTPPPATGFNFFLFFFFCLGYFLPENGGGIFL
jgi:hypothetical protein